MIKASDKPTKSNGVTAAVVLLLSLSVLTGAGCARGDGGKVVNVSGSTTVLPVVTAAGEEYQSRHPDIKIGVQGGGSSAGIEAVITGASDIGTSSRDLKDEETTKGLFETIIAIDAIAIIVNPANPISGLTQGQVQDIFSGKVLNWREVGGKDVPIVLVNRDEASGTREAFLKIAMDGVDFSKNAVIQPGTGQVRSIVGSTPGAIGYISHGYLTSDVKAVRYKGVVPTKANVVNGKYKLQRNLYFFTKGKPAGETKKFIDFVLGDWVQENIVSKEFVQAGKKPTEPTGEN